MPEDHARPDLDFEREQGRELGLGELADIPGNTPCPRPIARAASRGSTPPRDRSTRTDPGSSRRTAGCTCGRRPCRRGSRSISISETTLAVSWSFSKSLCPPFLMTFIANSTRVVASGESRNLDLGTFRITRPSLESQDKITRGRMQNAGPSSFRFPARTVTYALFYACFLDLQNGSAG